MKKNINTLEEMLTKLKCLFGDVVYSKYAKEVYGVKICKNNVDLDQLRDFIYLLEAKIKILKWNFAGYDRPDLVEPSVMYKTDISRFYEQEKYLTSCDRKFLEIIFKYL